MPAEIYVIQKHRELFYHYWGMYNSDQIHESQKQQWYRLAIETGVVMDYLGPTIDGSIILNADVAAILKKVNNASNLERQVSLPKLREELGIILKHTQMSRAKAYQPRNSAKILASR